RLQYIAIGKRYPKMCNIPEKPTKCDCASSRTNELTPNVEWHISPGKVTSQSKGNGHSRIKMRPRYMTSRSNHHHNYQAKGQSNTHMRYCPCECIDHNRATTSRHQGIATKTFSASTSKQ